MNIMNPIYSKLKVSTPSKYGVTEAKKADLDRLTNEVLIAQGEVEQLQAIVTALTKKSTNFQSFLTSATNNKERALNNKNFVDEVIQNAFELMEESLVAFTQMGSAHDSSKDVAKRINVVINKLIYSADVVNKLANTVIKEKALNPLISDELIKMIDKAGKDANSAVALCLTALQSSFAAQASNGESEAALELEYTESVKLFEVLTGMKVTPDERLVLDYSEDSIAGLLNIAYAKAVQVYENATIANDDTIKELEEAQSNLSSAQVRLKSLQAGLAAATAAALAS